MIVNNFNFSTVTGFNNSLEYIKVVGLVSRFVDMKCNLANVIEPLSSKISNYQINYMLSSLLIDKFKYDNISFNLNKKITKFHDIISQFKKWNQFNTVVVYHHPQLNILILNPTESKNWEDLELLPNEFISIYVKTWNKTSPNLIQQYLKDAKNVIEGVQVPERKNYSGPNPYFKTLQQAKIELAEKKAASQPAQNVQSQKSDDSTSANESQVQQGAADGAAKKQQAKVDNKKRRITPRYSIQVSNELFHNGNVEAWKNIIESYNSIHSEIEVLLFHNDERIKNVNALFKWGKVKHGDIIFFALAGENFAGVSKLQRYLYEGASNRYGQFMKKDMNQILKLF